MTPNTFLPSAQFPKIEAFCKLQSAPLELQRINRFFPRLRFGLSRPNSWPRSAPRRGMKTLWRVRRIQRELVVGNQRENEWLAHCSAIANAHVVCKCANPYRKNAGQIATKIPVEMPQKCRLIFATYTIPINCKIIQECREMGFILCAIAHTVFSKMLQNRGFCGNSAQ
jgi:hypothetical protein